MMILFRRTQRQTVTCLSLLLYHLTITLPITFCTAMQIRRTWTTKHWCKSVIEPEWPFAYSKYKGQKEETKGRVSTNKQDVRHICDTYGVQSKCHICEDIQCGKGGKGMCHFQLQGIDWNELSTNIPTVSDVPWAVNGSHRYDFGGEHTTHVCMYMSKNFPCQSSLGTDYSNCEIRCWGYQKGFSGLNNTAGITSHINRNKGPYRATWPNVRTDSIGRVNATPWTLSAPTATWSYPKSNPGSLPLNPKLGGNISFLPQGFTFTLAGAADGKAGFEDGMGSEARYDKHTQIFPEVAYAHNFSDVHFTHFACHTAALIFSLKMRGFIIQRALLLTMKDMCM